MPMERASRLTLIPMRQPMMAMNTANTAAFPRPTATCLSGRALCNARGT